MLSSKGIQLIFSSWDVIKNIPNYQQVFSDQLSEKLGNSTVAEWFSGPTNPHNLVFVKMIDLIVHLLGPDLDVIIEELTSLGRRHHRYHSDMIGFFQQDLFCDIADAFIEIIRSCIQEQGRKEAASNEGLVSSDDSVLHPSQLEPVTEAWSEIFTMIRAIMKQGVKIEVKRHKKRAEKHRQEILKMQERRSSGSTKSMSETSSECGSIPDAPILSSSPTTSPKSRLSRNKRYPKRDPTRGIGRAFSASLTSFGGSNRIKSSKLSEMLLSDMSNSDDKKKSKVAALAEKKTLKTRPKLRSSLSLKRLRLGRN